MGLFVNLRLRRKLLVALAPLAIMVILSGLYGSYESQKIDRWYSELIDKDVKAAQNVDKARALTMRYGLYLYRLIVETDPDRMHNPKHHTESHLIEYDLADGRHVALSERVAAYHRAVQRNDVEMIFNVRHTDGRTERLVMAWTLRYFFRYEVEHLLARCGFRLESTYGTFDCAPLNDDSPEMIFVATVA